MIIKHYRKLYASAIYDLLLSLNYVYSIHFIIIFRIQSYLCKNEKNFGIQCVEKIIIVLLFSQWLSCHSLLL